MIYYRDADTRFCYVVMRSDISAFAKFKGFLEKEKYFDYETPYGYGGPLSDDTIPEESQKRFLREMTEYSMENGVVSQFIRFHPLLANHKSMPDVFETRYLHDTIYINTDYPDLIMENMESKNRNMVRKAVKSGVTVERREIGDYSDFIPIYEETMKRDGAAEYYFFPAEYFRSQMNLKEYACIFYAMVEKQPIAGAMMYFNDKFMHYHLAGTLTEFRKYSSNNLLLYEAAKWACEKGIKRFHLGGGMALDDSLFGFKKQFNKNGRLPFVVGRTIFDPACYQKLLYFRKTIDPDFYMDNERMIQYRA